MRRQGFTLIELLAVIVVVAIIVVIATPIILNVVGDAREESAIDSLKGYIDGAESALTANDLDEEEDFPIPDSNGCYSLKELEPYIKVKGNRPTIDNTDKICMVNGDTTYIDEVIIDGYKVSYENGKYQSNGKVLGT